VKIFYPILKCCPLFADIGADDLGALLSCLSARRSAYERGAFIFVSGGDATRVGVVLSGGVHVVKEDYEGNRAILTRVGPGGLFGEAFACAGTKKLPVGVVAAEDSVILSIDMIRIVTVCSSACGFHAGLIRNMLRVLAEKNLSMMQKLEHITRRTTREKLLSYLSAAAKEAESAAFDIPFNRQELADYLSVDRSAMSAELSAMRRDGLLLYARNHFTLL
jgi:CRP-like cAMP-binding protein